MVQGSMFEVRYSKFDIRCSKFFVQGSRFRVPGSRFLVRSSIFDVQNPRATHKEEPIGYEVIASHAHRNVAILSYNKNHVYCAVIASHAQRDEAIPCRIRCVVPEAATQQRMDGLRCLLLRCGGWEDWVLGAGCWVLGGRRTTHDSRTKAQGKGCWGLGKVQGAGFASRSLL